MTKLVVKWVSYCKEKIRNAFITVTTAFHATHNVGRQIKAVQEKDGEVSGRRLERERQRGGQKDANR